VVWLSLFSRATDYCSRDEVAEIGLGSAAEGTTACADQRAYLPAGAPEPSEFVYIQYAALCRFRECACFQYHAVVKPNG